MQKDKHQGKTEVNAPLDHGRINHISRRVEMEKGHGYGHGCKEQGHFSAQRPLPGLFVFPFQKDLGLFIDAHPFL